MSQSASDPDRGPNGGRPREIVVVGGGPAGSFFAIEAMTQARQLGQDLAVTIIEQKAELRSHGGPNASACREGCNYCAGGISPRLSDTLDAMGISVPAEVIQSEVESVTIQGSWKHIEMEVPPGRRMFSVYRGSRPCLRSNRSDNFDAFLLSSAIDCGARVITGRACTIDRLATGRMIVRYAPRVHADEVETVEADFVVMAAGVNQAAGSPLEESSLVDSLRRLIPGFRPPAVRKSLICELRCETIAGHSTKGDVYFVEYGSKGIDVEMSSLVPKEEGLITLVLLGRSIDRARESDRSEIVERFLQLPHVRRLLPRFTTPRPVCICAPNMTVGTATGGGADGIAVIGDLVVTRLYKDGILSAHRTAKALASCLLNHGGDAGSLGRFYWPVVRAIARDNCFGRLVFFLNRVAFSHPTFSRVLYQAVLTERRTRKRQGRHLERLLWKIASGDDSYANILRSMITLRSLSGIFFGGLLVTIRNYLTEALFGLRWSDVARYPTGVYREVLEAKRRQYAAYAPTPASPAGFDFESMYSIRIRSDRQSVLEQLGKFGEPDMSYFHPRIVRIRRLSGHGVEPGKTIAYNVPLRALQFSIKLEAAVDERYIVYRVQSGFAQGGVLLFELEPARQGSLALSIYVAFNFPRGISKLSRLRWRLFRLLFPRYVHDVLWNYALCRMKAISEDSSANARCSV